jgi:pyruvate/2-oxoacid:ferredoxin oxidoreductase alpha subunit
MGSAALKCRLLVKQSYRRMHTFMGTSGAGLQGMFVPLPLAAMELTPVALFDCGTVISSGEVW